MKRGKRGRERETIDRRGEAREGIEETQENI